MLANHFKRFAGLRVLNGDRLIFLKDLPVVIGIISAMSGVILWLSITLTFATYIVRTLLQQRLCCRFFFLTGVYYWIIFLQERSYFRFFFLATDILLQELSASRPVDLLQALVRGGADDDEPWERKSQQLSTEISSDGLRRVAVHACRIACNRMTLPTANQGRSTYIGAPRRIQQEVLFANKYSLRLKM